MQSLLKGPEIQFLSSTTSEHKVEVASCPRPILCISLENSRRVRSSLTYSPGAPALPPTAGIPEEHTHLLLSPKSAPFAIHSAHPLGLPGLQFTVPRTVGGLPMAQAEEAPRAATLTLFDICWHCCSVVWIRVWSKSTMSTSFLFRCSRCWSSLPNCSAC